MRYLVAYCDGSARPNPGYTGFGIHSYIGDVNIKPKNIKNKYKSTIMGYIEKSKPIEQEIGIEKIVDIYGYTNGNTNNTAELDAVIELLKYYNLNKDNVFTEISNIVIVLDSSYVKQFVDRILSNDDLSHINTNADRIKELIDIINILKDNINISTIKVEGHSENLGNDRADLLSNLGRIANIRKLNDFNVVISDVKEYWNYKIDTPPYFNTKYVFSFSYKEKGNKIYQLLNTKDVEEIGRRGNEYSYYLVYSKQDMEYINDMFNHMHNLLGKLIKPLVVSLEKVFSNDINRNIKLYGDTYIDINKDPIIKIETLDGNVIGQEVYPTDLSYLANNRFVILEDLYASIKDNLNTNDNIIIMDITDQIYTTNDKGKTILKKDIKNDNYIIKIDVNEINNKIFVTPGIDTIKRNSLKKLESHNPNVYLIVELKDNIGVYHTLVRSDYGDVLVSASNSNIVYIKQQHM